jgi:hypothetical protein
VDPLIIPGTTQVDLQMFKDNLLASYYGEYTERPKAQTQETECAPSDSMIGKLKDQLLKKNSNTNFWVAELTSKSALLNKENF